MTPLDPDHTISHHLRCDETLDNIRSAILDLIGLACSQKSSEFPPSDIPGTHSDPLLARVCVALGLVQVRGCSWDITNGIPLVKPLCNLSQLHIVIVLLQDVTFFRRKVPCLRDTLSHDDCICQTEGELGSPCCVLRPKLVAEPFKLSLEDILHSALHHNFLSKSKIYFKNLLQI